MLTSQWRHKAEEQSHNSDTKQQGLLRMSLPPSAVSSSITSLRNSWENDQLLSHQRVFRKEFGFSSGQIGECAKHKGGRRKFRPTQKTFLKRMKAETDTLFDESEYKQHELTLSFVKMGALEDAYKQHGPCLLYAPLTSFGKEACSIVRNMPISRTDVPSGMPLRGREEHESAFFVQYPLFRATFEGSPMSCKRQEESGSSSH
jgi:hypothetical protein